MTRLALAATCLVAFAAPVPARDDDDVPLASVPPKVLAAVKKLFPNGKNESASKDTDGGTTHFTVTLKSGGSTYEVTATEAGTVTEVAREMAFKDLPKAVAAAAQKRYPKATFDSVAEVTVPGVKGKTYHLEVTTAAGKDVEAVFDPAGKLVSEE